MQAVLLPLRQIIEHAVRRGIIATNPLDRLDRNLRPRKARTEKRCPNVEEIAKLLDASEDEGVRTLLALSVSTGDGTLAEPKTPQAKREVDLGASLVAMLRTHKLRSLHSQPGDFVFPAADGSRLHYRAAVRALEAAAKAANLNPDGLPKLRWHDLRHTAASLLIAAGLNVPYVSRQLGHAKPEHHPHRVRARVRTSGALGAGTGGDGRGARYERGSVISRVGGRFDPPPGESCDVRMVSRSNRWRWASASSSGSVSGLNHLTTFVKMFMS